MRDVDRDVAKTNAAVGGGPSAVYTGVYYAGPVADAGISVIPACLFLVDWLRVLTLGVTLRNVTG